MARKRGRAAARKQTSTAGLTRKQQSRVERERRLERYLIISAAVVGIAVVGVLGYGLLNEFVIEAASPVATVGETPIRSDEFESRVRFLRANMALQLQQWVEQRRSIDPSDETSDFVLNYIDQNISQLEATLAEENKGFIGGQAVEQLVRHEIVRQEAVRRGITATPDEVQRKVELDFNFDRDAASLPLTQTEVVTPGGESELLPTPVPKEAYLEQYDFFLKDILKPLGISEKRYLSWVEADVLEQKVRAQMAAGVPTEADHIAFRVLVISDEGRADDLAARLDAGEAFQTLVDEIDAEDETTDYVRDFEWLPRDRVAEALSPEMASELWDLPPGGHSGVIATPDGLNFYIAEVKGHEVRELETALLELLLDGEFEKWLAAQRDAFVEIGSYLDRTPSNP